MGGNDGDGIRCGGEELRVMGLRLARCVEELSVFGERREGFRLARVKAVFEGRLVGVKKEGGFEVEEVGFYTLEGGRADDATIAKAE